MEALIRSVRLDSARTRLGAVRAEDGLAPIGGAGISASENLDRVRAQLERDVREELLSQAKAAFETERERAHAQGYAAGLLAAEVDAAKQQARTLSDMRDRAAESFGLLERAHRAALAALEATVGDVVFECICRLLGRHALSSACVLGLVEEVVTGLRVGVIQRARLHPRDLGTLRSLLSGRDPQDLAARLEALSIDLVADESIALGGCVIETAAGEYDGGLETQLRRLHAVLHTAVDEGSTPCGT